MTNDHNKTRDRTLGSYYTADLTVKYIVEKVMRKAVKPLKSDLNIVLSQSNQLLSLVNDILDAAAIGKNTLLVASERVNIVKVVGRCVSIMQPQVMGPKRLINATKRLRGKIYVTGDATRLQQV